MHGHELNPLDRSWIFNGSAEDEASFKPLCQQVEKHYQLPVRRLCRYFACSDDGYLIDTHGPYFRGFLATFPARHTLPKYLLNCFFHPLDVFFHAFGDFPSFDETVAFDNLIYIRRSTCADTTGLVTTYAHELQHFVQDGNTPRLLAVNGILEENLKTFEPTATVFDIPSEREANIVSKRVAENVCGSDAVKAFADEQVRLMEEAGEHEQKARWIFFRDVPSSTKYHLLEETLLLVEKYKTRIDFPKYIDEPEWWLGPRAS